MRIGLNLLFLIPGIVGGVETYAVSLIKALASIDRTNEYFLFVNRESSVLDLADAPNFHRIVCGVQATCRVLRYAWEQLVLPFQLRNYRLDLIHSLGYVGPVITPCPGIVTIPDLNYIILRNFIPAGRRRALQFFSIRSARQSVRVITISNFSKAQIVRFIGVPSDKITVTHLGAGWTKDGNEPGRFESIRKSYRLPERYIVAFGGGSPHKNIPRLISAFREIAREFPHSLVLLGHLPPNVDLPSLKQDDQLSRRVMPLGYISREHIGPILSQADLFVLPSLYEGFGMPVLEAQSSQVPVVCAMAGALPEVAGAGAFFFDPLSVDGMVQAIRRCLSDADLRSELRRLGEKNVKQFSWEKTARETLAVYQQVDRN